MRDPTYEAKRNQKKAVLAWSSRQRFEGSCEPLVRLLERTYAYIRVRKMLGLDSNIAV